MTKTIEPQGSDTTDRPLRIIHCFRSPVGGIFRHIRDLVDYHSAQGHQVGILCDSITGGKYEDDLFEEMRPKLALGLHKFPMQRQISLSDIGTFRKVYKEFKNLQPDVLHGHGAKGGAYVRFLGSKLRGSKSRVTRVYSTHGGSLHYDANSLKGRVYFKIERFLERWTDAIVFVSDYERQAYFKKVGVPSVASHLVYNGVGDDEFEPVAANKDAADFLYIGMMRDLKGPDVFIDAVRIAEKLVGHPLRAVMVGDGPDKDRYVKLINKAGLSNRIAVNAAMHAREAFKLAKYVIVPSRAEAMPYIVLETIAAQKQIIATNVGGIPEILGSDCDAMVPPDDAKRLGAAMASSLEEEGWLASCQPDRAEFKKRFSVSTMAEQILQVYRAG